MLSKIHYLLLSLLLVTFNASADVAYHWISAQNSVDRPHGFILDLILSDAAIMAGYVDYHSPACALADSCAASPNSPISYFYSSLYSPIYEPHYTITYFPQEQLVWPAGGLNVSVNIGLNGLLDGDISINSPEFGFFLSGNNGLFTVDRYYINNSFACLLHGSICMGATGFISAVSTVPEPNTIALLSLAMLGLIASRRISKSN